MFTNDVTLNENIYHPPAVNENELKFTFPIESTDDLYNFLNCLDDTHYREVLVCKIRSNIMRRDSNFWFSDLNFHYAYIVHTLQTIGWNNSTENGSKYLEVFILAGYSETVQLDGAE